MTRTLKEGEVLVHFATRALRGPDGMPIGTEELYKIVPADQVKAHESGAAPVIDEDVAAMMAGKFKQYMDGIRRHAG